MSTMINLQPSERQELEQCEKVVKAGLKNFIEVGNALFKIKKGKLYRETHSTWDEYISQKWDMTCRRADQLIDASEVVGKIGTVVPINEHQARELSKVEPQKRVEVLEKAKKLAEGEDRKMTAGDIAWVNKEADCPTHEERPRVQTATEIAQKEQFEPDLAKTVNDAEYKDALEAVIGLPFGYQTQFIDELLTSSKPIRDFARAWFQKNKE